MKAPGIAADKCPLAQFPHLKQYRNIGATTQDKLYQGLYNQRLKDLTAFRFEDNKATEADQFKLLCKNYI